MLDRDLRNDVPVCFSDNSEVGLRHWLSDGCMMVEWINRINPRVVCDVVWCQFDAEQIG